MGQDASNAGCGWAEGWYESTELKERKSLRKMGSNRQTY